MAPRSIALPRPLTSLVVSWLAWVVLGWNLIDVLARGTASEKLRFAPALALLGFLAWVVFFAPRVIVHPDALEVRQIWRTFSLPWGRIVNIRTAVGVRIDYMDAAGRVRAVHPWGTKTARPLLPGGLRGTGASFESMLDAWRQAEDDSKPPVVRWNVVGLAGFLALAVLAVLLCLVAR